MNNFQSTFFNHQSKGYTLIEVIIAVQIFLIVLTMAYTIYLFGYKFMVRWNDDNDLLATELLIQKSLSNELTTAKKIIEITENEILYTDRNYNFQKITWTNDSLIIKHKLLNKPGIKITYQKIRFLQCNEEKSQLCLLSELDLNNDDKISDSELDKICFLKIDNIISNKNKKILAQVNLQIIQ